MILTVEYIACNQGIKQTLVIKISTFLLYRSTIFCEAVQDPGDELSQQIASLPLFLSVIDLYKFYIHQQITRDYLPCFRAVVLRASDKIMQKSNQRRSTAFSCQHINCLLFYLCFCVSLTSSDAFQLTATTGTRNQFIFLLNITYYMIILFLCLVPVTATRENLA